MYRSLTDRAAAGRAARAAVPRDSQAQFDPAGRRDPIELVTADSAVRLPDLLPVRYGRMLSSPLAYFRGTAAVMAADLATTPSPKLIAQLCGDAHLANFGVYSTPRRRLVFDITHFDETAPGPFEWDIKRLAASFEVAGRVRGDRKKVRREYIEACVREYRETMQDLANAPMMAVWDVHLDVERTLLPRLRKARRTGKKITAAASARAHTANQLYPQRKLVTVSRGTTRLATSTPYVAPIAGMPEAERDALFAELEALVAGYSRTLSPEYRHLLGQFRLVDAARRAVGVGSVGTRTFLLLLDSGNGEDPLLLQARQAELSVLEAHAGVRKVRGQHGQRVVTGERLMQASADGFLGWHKVAIGGATEPDAAGGVRDYYVRQVRDGRYTADVESLKVSGVEVYARMCGWTLAHAHARSGDRVAIAAYLGNSDAFDRAVTAFADTYADQNELDYAAFQRAHVDGLITAVPGV